ncbi:phosphate ABC transporter permease subunit PstC [Halotalea alkalilenta]|uniref:phosphate ABC transporter permease subunit PstC n=1 Tax=Halotalea alkalilenta TaxID=376489 RepID=UPI0005BCC38A|nr:phosphate ABC transporter permease subunit PstC [Halotalea alkalilenta]
MSSEQSRSDQPHHLGANRRELRLLARNGMIDRWFERGTCSFAVLVLALLGAIMLSLLISAWPALATYGADFFTQTRWSANQEVFGAWPAIYGTLVTSLIAVAIAVPVSFGIAIFLTEKCPAALRRPLGVTIELLAGIPSIIYGMWGIMVLGPFLQWLAPELFPAGTGLATAGIILAVMIIPFITAITRDVMSTVPSVTRESAYGLGCTTWEVVRSVIFPSVRGGLVGGVILGLGRALGETMAVAFVIGNNLFLHPTLTGQGTSIAALIASQFPEADGIQRSALLALGLVLFLITFVVLAIARYMLMRIERRAP